MAGIGPLVCAGFSGFLVRALRSLRAFVLVPNVVLHFTGVHGDAADAGTDDVDDGDEDSCDTSGGTGRAWW